MDKRFFKSWVLRIPHRLRDLLWMVRAWSSVAPIFSSVLMSRFSSSSQILLKVITSFWHTFLAWMDSWSWEAIQDGYHHFCILLFFFYHFKLFCILDLHILQLFSESQSFDLCSYLQIAWSRNQTSSVSLGKTFMVQVDPWLNQRWSSWPWPSYSYVRLWASSPSGFGISKLM